MFFIPSKLFPKLAFQSLRTGATRRAAHRRSRLRTTHPTALYRTEQLEDRVLLTAGPWYDLQELSLVGDVVNGSTVAIDGDTMLVGSKNVNSVAEYAGVAHVYQRDDAGTPSDPGDDRWFLHQELLPVDLMAGDWFGANVSISGDTLVVTAQHAMSACCPSERPGDGLGVAYVYERIAGTWEFQQKLEPSERVEGDDASFGWSIDLQGDLLAIGARLEDHILEDSSVHEFAGAVYVYRLDNVTGVWSEEARLIDANAAQSTAFGNSVDIDQGEIVVGTLQGDGAVIDSGTVQVFAETAPGT